MVYYLKHYDTVLLKFEANANSSNPDYQILWINDEKKNLLPLTMVATEESLERWLKHRTIPKNRAYVHNFLAKCGLNINRPMNIIAVSKGLSLNDCYWVVDENFEGDYANNNLYDNRFSNVLASLVFTGYEPYSQYYAYQIASALGLDTVPYNLSKWKGNLCSVCELFTSKKYSYVPVGYLKTRGGMQAVREYYRELGPVFEKALDDMILFDAIICNVDRHFGNFGVIVDSETNTIVGPAPLFDHGNSLFNFAWADEWESDENLEMYVSTLQPCVYDDFMESAREILNAERRADLHRLLEFRFKKHVRYNLPEKRLKMIERQIQKRVRSLLASVK